ncbi:MAG: ribosome small subunit-dependent GTPase A [Bacteroidota bacterium]|jgi:ribosome biogenesis GTPase|nr:ribosome small subunit-dependent GTPase A [Cytophagales bacterium]MCE2957731.1 ribosome small subunit-dependent GTPase A [Flammeovirgaceae bacterium]MCZ8071713.1 ribosome small subunit-dependent GTPase A [Cytophagales bacterium]
MKGRVLKSTGSWYEVLIEGGQVLQARARGKLRLDDINETNPVAVGDWVELQPEGNNAVISAILPRQNHMLRQSVKKKGQAHVLAANIDQVMLIATLKQPRTSLGFIDRFLVSAEAFRIPQVIIFNKRDLLTETELEEQTELMQRYQIFGKRTLALQATHDDLLEVNEILKNKVTLVAGHSGAGKSTLLNRLSDRIQQATSNISSFSNKGTHTTTFAEMFRLDEHSFVIDTPGVKEWGLVDMEPQELSDYFPEMRAVRTSCKFGARCIHLHEPGCAVIAAVENQQISLARYESYLSMLAGEDNRK